MSEGVCAITGANGYLGSVVARWFADRGWKVVALTRSKTSEPYLHVPFSLDSTLEPDVFKTHKITTLIHCAYDFRPVDWASIRKVNVEGSERLLQAAKQGGVEKIIFISSISAFRGCASLYGRAKLEIEELTTQVGGAIVRPGLIYGDTSTGGMFGALRSQVLSKSVIPLIGSGEYLQYLVHEDDLCTLLQSIAEDKLSLERRAFDSGMQSTVGLAQPLASYRAAGEQECEICKGSVAICLGRTQVPGATRVTPQIPE